MPPRPLERIAHTAASPEGENSTYVLPDDGLVVDPGPPTESAWETLVTGLSAAGLPVESVETVVVTHWHADHAGLAPRLAEAATAELVLHEADAPLVANYAEARARRLERDGRRLREWGVPEATVEDVISADTASPMPDQCRVTGVTDGESVAGATVVHTPGHTAGHLALDVGDALFVGDAVLPTYTPNVGGSDTRVDDALATYLDTLDRLREYGDSAGGASATGTVSGLRTLPGHGSTVELVSRIETIRTHHAERVRDVVAALPDPDGSANPSGRTPWAVAEDLFGGMRGIHVKMGAGEAAAHLSFAADRRLVERVSENPDRYVQTGTSLEEASALVR